MPSAAFRFRPASAALLLALGLGATCCGTSVQAQGAWASGLDEQDALPGSASALPAGVRRLPDVPYGPDARQRIDVYLPAHPQPGRAPLRVFVHGGAWMAGARLVVRLIRERKGLSNHRDSGRDRALIVGRRFGHHFGRQCITLGQLTDKP